MAQVQSLALELPQAAGTAKNKDYDPFGVNFCEGVRSVLTFISLLVDA